MAGKGKKKAGGSAKKHGRERRKRMRHGSPISRYARGLITFDQYMKLTSGKG